MRRCQKVSISLPPSASSLTIVALRGAEIDKDLIRDGPAHHLLHRLSISLLSYNLDRATRELNPPSVSLLAAVLVGRVNVC